MPKALRTFGFDSVRWSGGSLPADRLDLLDKKITKCYSHHPAARLGLRRGGAFLIALGAPMPP